MDRDDEFSKLITKFLFLNCVDENDHEEYNKSEINVLLNDLNSLNYNSKKIIDQNGVFHLFESLTTISSDEETLIVKSCCLISTLIIKQKIQLPFTIFEKLIEWLSKCLELNFRSVAYDVLSCLKVLFKHHPCYCLNYWEKFLLPDTLLLNILNERINNELPEDYDTNSDTEIFVATIICIQNLLSYSDNDKLTETHDGILVTLGIKILDLLYTNRIDSFNNSGQRIVFITSALNILYKISNENHEWAEENLGKLLGIAKVYIHHGLPDIIQVKPQKVVISQQSLLEPVVVPMNKGGKVPKTRKLKTVNKNRKADKNKKTLKKDVTDSNNLKTNIEVEFDLNFLSPFNRTSDSDFSGSEVISGGGHNRTQNQMHKEAKLRLSAISLIGLIAKTFDKKTLYGYWHALFPSESLSHNSSEFLNCILRDPNARNRTAAVQTASILLFGSKSYLIQAENSDKAPKTFTPFSISLGNMMLAIYEVLTQALSTESSLPVLTQILKCLSVLIQNTPFHRLRKGFVTKFVHHIRQLVQHKDPTIQVAALIVMEFLISVQETTAEIFECIGLSKSNFNTIRTNQNYLNDSGVEEVIEAELDEEFLSDSDQENYLIETKSESNNTEYISSEISWLLQKVLENLGITFNNSKKVVKITTPVRIESLQVLSSMALHFLLIKDHLELISTALKSSLIDNQSDIRLYTAKCLDVVGHSINKYLLENSITNIDKDLIICQNFWTNILPVTIEKIQDQNQNSVLKAYLCDFLSNMGVHIFERLPQNVSIQIISLLTGIGCCNEESTVRAAAVRALAVYIVFPSLREDLCFIENTAELSIQLMKDSNLYTRVKASWAMGNISDAFIMNSNESRLDKISDGLLKEMLEVAIDTTNDNDKVRSNAVRTLGNLLRLISEEHLKLELWRLLCIEAIKKLSNCINSNGNAKVKWNSCYAIGNCMKNSALFKSYGNWNWQKIIFPSLCNLIVNNTNFKVRINGAAALIVIDRREYYGTYMNQIWSSLLLAIEQSDNLVDFNEYKHRDNLQEQLCLTLSHMIKLATLDDLLFFKSELISKLETVKQIWIRVLNRILPESEASLTSCIIQLKDSLLKNNLTNDQRNSIQVILSCLTQNDNPEL